MKRIYHILICGLAALLLSSCDDDYLYDHDQKPLLRAQQALYITPETRYYEHEMVIPQSEDSFYTIGKFPKRLHFQYLEGNLKSGRLTLKFTVNSNPELSTPQVYESSISIVVSGVGVYEIPIYFVGE